MFDLRPVPPVAFQTKMGTVERQTSTSELSEITAAWMGVASLSHRKSYGQFMTPRAVRERLISRLPLFPGIRVLDPGVGTGEFLRSVLDREPTAEVVGWDVDPLILESAATLVPEATLEERTALHPYVGEPFDLVVGNPPYFQFRAAAEVRTHFAQVISGRPNIFALFFQVGMEILKRGGRLAYVVPPSMNNGAYFEALREYIVSSSAIEHLEILDGSSLFDGANTAVQLIVMKSGAKSDDHIFVRCAESGFQRTIFSQDPERLSSQFEGRRTLFDLGYEAVTGSLVWNQNKERLQAEPTESTVPLLWAHNIVDGGLRLKSTPKRPQYVEVQRRLRGPALIANRIVGAVGSGELRCALVPDGMEFVGENHVNVIRSRQGVEPEMSWEDLLEALRRPEVVSRLRLLTGNTQISATELNHLLPLDV